MKRIAFATDAFELHSPAQQLLDRFLLAPGGCEIVLHAPVIDAPLLKQRALDFNLQLAASPQVALAGANAVVLAPGTKELQPWPVAKLIDSAAPGSALYIDGLLLRRRREIEEAEHVANSRGLRVKVGTAASFLVQIPAQPKFERSRVDQALILAQGVPLLGELEALYALDAAAGLSKEASGLRQCMRLAGDALWRAAYSSRWRPLLSAAASHSNNVKGDPERDGRTQDVVGLQLFEKLAPNARGWLIEPRDAPQILVILCDEALGDFNYAVRVGRAFHSAQLYRPPAPQRHHYSGQAASIQNFFANPSNDLAAGKFVTSILDRCRFGSSKSPGGEE